MTANRNNCDYYDENFECFFKAYLECAFWISKDHIDEYIDTSYEVSDLSESALSALCAFARIFFDDHYSLIDELINKGGITPTGHSLWIAAGHDLWLTQNGHGTGFWDRPYWGVYQDKFTEAGEALGEVDIYVGDDGKLYI